MPTFTLHRNHLLRTTKGISVRFEKGVPTHVPSLAVNDAVAIGAVPAVEDRAQTDVIPPEPNVQIPLTPAQRKEKIFEAFAEMVERNNRSDFTASGTPNAKKLVPMVGFDMSTNERDTLWREFRANMGEAEDS